MIKLFNQSIGRLRLTKTKISICGLAASAAVISMLALAATPARAAQPLLVATIHVSQVEVCWNSTSNLTYQVQYRSDLTTNLWTSLVDCVLGNGSVKCLSYPVVVGEPQRFYRVVETNCVPSPEGTLILEVACDGRTSTVNRVDPSATTTPGRGDVGIVNGFIFPAGTIPPGDNAFDLDVPARIGDWVCLNSRGALPAPRGSAVTYYFAMPDLETAGLVTQGFNSHRFPGSIPVAHAIVGGTGAFSGETGEVIEEVIGKNKTGAFNLRYYIKIKKQSPQ